MSVPFFQATGSDPGIRLALPPGQAIIFDGRRMTLAGRARDRTRRFVFVDPDGLPVDFSDAEVLVAQAERRLAFLSRAEAAVLAKREVDGAGRPVVTLDSAENQTQREAFMNEALRKFEYIHAWELAGHPPRTAVALKPICDAVAERTEDLKAHSPRSVSRWIAAYLDADRSLDALVPQTMNRGNFEDRLVPAARDLLTKTAEEYYLVDTRPTVRSVYMHVRAAFDEYNEPLLPSERLETPSLNSVYAEIARIDKYTLEYCRTGKRAADQRYRPIGTSPLATMANKVWEIDHTRINCIAIDKRSGIPIGRPWITVIIDRYSRMIVGIWVSFDPPSVSVVFQCLRVGILPKADLLKKHGVVGVWLASGRCKTLVPDQGVEFKAKSFVAAMLQLGIDVEYTPILKPWYKGKIERVIKTLLRAVFENVPGTVFANIFERNKEKIPEKVAVATLDDLWSRTLHFVVNIYNKRAHRTMLASPDEIWKASASQEIHPPINPARLDQVLTLTLWRRPQKQGVYYLGLQYNSKDLADYIVRSGVSGIVMIKIDPSNLGCIWWVDPLDGEQKKLEPVGPNANVVEGRTLENYKIALAIKRANPERFAGEQGIQDACVFLDNTMKHKSGDSGLANKKKALAAWKKVNKVLGPEDPSEFEDGPSGDISENIFAGSNGIVDTSEHVVKAEPARKTPKASSKSKSKTTTVTASTEVEPTTEDDFDLDAYARENGMNAEGKGSDSK